VNELNQYTKVGGIDRGYDNNGNLTDNGEYLFCFDHKNRLVEVREFGSPDLSWKTDGKRPRTNSGRQ